MSQPKPTIKYKYSVKSGALTATTTALKPAKVPDPPAVYYTDKVWQQLDYIVAKCKEEVGWLGLVDVIDDQTYLITDIYVPKQEVSGATTDIESEDIARLVHVIMDEGKDPSKLRYWGHSHVNMGVAPSGRDEDQINEYLEDTDWFIRGIYNKKGDSKVDFYDVTGNVIHQCVYNGLWCEPLAEAEYEALDQILKDNVLKRTYVVPARIAPKSRPQYSPYYRNAWDGWGWNDVAPGAEAQQRIDEFDKEWEERVRQRKEADPFYFEG